MRGLLLMCVMRAWSTGHRVVSTRMPRMASGEAFHGKPAAVERPEPLHRLQGVVGARRIEATTRAQKWAHESLIKMDQECDGVAHCSVTFFQSAIRLPRNSAPAASRARPRALTTRSTGG